MEKYIYYSICTGHGTDDVAITEANSLEEAVINFKTYFNNASIKNVQLIDCNRKGYVKNMMIISDY